MGTLRQAFQKLVQQTQLEMQQTTAVLPPEAGTVAAVNSDGTINVQTQSSYYTGIGNAVADITLGAQVLVITTAEGTKTTVPQ